MADQLEIPFVEAALIGHLDVALAEPVASKVPNPRPPAFVRLNLTGGEQINLAQANVVVLVEAYAATDVLAWRLAQKAWRALHGRSELALGYGVELGDRDLSVPINYPDPATSQSRYQFTLGTTVNLKEPTS